MNQFYVSFMKFESTILSFSFEIMLHFNFTSTSESVIRKFPWLASLPHISEQSAVWMRKPIHYLKSILCCYDFKLITIVALLFRCFVFDNAQLATWWDFSSNILNGWSNMVKLQYHSFNLLNIYAHWRLKGWIERPC